MLILLTEIHTFLCKVSSEITPGSEMVKGILTSKSDKFESLGVGVGGGGGGDSKGCTKGYGFWAILV